VAIPVSSLTSLRLWWATADRNLSGEGAHDPHQTVTHACRDPLLHRLDAHDAGPLEACGDGGPCSGEPRVVRVQDGHLDTLHRLPTDRPVDHQERLLQDPHPGRAGGAQQGGRHLVHPRQCSDEQAERTDDVFIGDRARHRVVEAFQDVQDGCGHPETLPRRAAGGCTVGVVGAERVPGQRG